VFFAACLAPGLALTGISDGFAGERFVKRTSQTAASSNYSPAPSAHDGAKYERKCVTMSCGTPWCYNTRVQ
jgi:hypothetical protein